jgi:(R,R)-butanediol dehydrogenase/meso-butanediol dehydrogenase/diacetyl reductase
MKEGPSHERSRIEGGVVKALRWHGRLDVRLDDVAPPPPPGPGQVQIAVTACGICGTDVEEWREGPLMIPVTTPHALMGGIAPLTLGHEVAGEVIALGPGVSLAVGDRVAVDGLMTCGHCRQCLTGRPNLCAQSGQVGFSTDGGLQSLVNVPAATSVVMPAGLPAEAGAIAETLSVGVRALRRGRLAPGDRVTVVGGGPVGLLALQAARSMGAGHTTVIEPLEKRRALALELGADEAAPPHLDADSDGNDGDGRAWNRPSRHGPGDGADVVLECSGHPGAISAAIASAGPAGRIVLVGIGGGRPPLDAWDVILREKEIVGSVSHICAEDFAGALTMLATGAIQWEPLLTRVPLTDALDQGLMAMVHHPERHVKIVITPDAT